MQKLILAVLLVGSTALAGTLPVLKYRALDNSGNAISGAKLYFYEDTTETPLATYSNEALTSVNANPVVADSAGYFGEIYLKTDEQYKVILKTAAGVTIWTVDDINATELVNTSLTARVGQIATNPLDYGALGDGVADESADIQEAIDAATGTIDLLGKTYRCDSALTMDSGLTLKNGTLDFSNSAVNSYIIIQGTAGGANALTSSATLGAVTLAVTSGTGIAADDWLLLYSGGDWISGYNVAEIVQVSSIVGTTVTLKSPIEAGYATGDGAAVKELVVENDVWLQDLNITMNASAGGTGIGVLVNMAQNVHIRGVQFENAKRAGVQVKQSHGVYISESTFEQSSTSGYGVETTAAAQDVHVTDSTFLRLRTAIMFGPSGEDGPVRWNYASGNSLIGVQEGVEFGPMAQYIWVTDNAIVGDTSGGTTTGSGIGGAAYDFTLRGNSIREMGGDGIYIDVSSVTYDDSKTHSAVIDGNRIYTVDETGIEFVGVSAIDVSPAITNNTIYEAVTAGVDVTYGKNARVIGNSITGLSSAGEGVIVESCDIVTIADNVIKPTGALGYGIHLVDGAAGTYASVTGNYIDGTDQAYLIYQDMASDDGRVHIANNHLRDGTYGVYQDQGTLLLGEQLYSSMATGEIWSNQLGIDGPQSHKISRVTYSFSDGSVGVHSSTETLPDNAVIVRAYYYVVTTFQSAGPDAATISIGIPTDDVAGIVAAIAISDGSNPWDAGWHECIQVGTTATFANTTTATRAIDFTVGVQTLTAGSLFLFLEYVII